MTSVDITVKSKTAAAADFDLTRTKTMEAASSQIQTWNSLVGTSVTFRLQSSNYTLPRTTGQTTLTASVFAMLGEATADCATAWFNTLTATHVWF